jgi:flagellar biosynthesis protein FlhA
VSVNAPMGKTVTKQPNRWTALLGPLILILILAMIVVPMPPIMLDILFTFNITFALLVLFATLHVQHPLDFSAFPTILLLTTLLRLALNVAAARVILLDGYHGDAAAGIVIESFGRFVVGGNYVVGLVVFAILVVINFVVVTKGATRIAEVSARFSLDAMPGKQMAVDADMNAGMITQDEARHRRGVIAAEADFYGSMDGASKFVRGDAIAAIIIIAINLLGGLIIAVFQHGMSLTEAFKTYSLLSIGDGLVAQIPSLIISMAAGLLISRSGNDGEVGPEIAQQIFTLNLRGLLITAVTLALTGVIPGMPHAAFLFYAVLTGALWRYLSLQTKNALDPAGTTAQASATEGVAVTEVIDSKILKPTESLSLDVGYALIPLVTQGGDLQKRLNQLRRRVSEQLGFLLPAIHVQDDLTLRPGGYRIQVHGVQAGFSEVRVGEYMAVAGKANLAALQGGRTIDPIFGNTAYWIRDEQREDAELLGYTVIDAATVVTTHLHEVMQEQREMLFGLRQTQELLDLATSRNARLVESVVPRVISIPGLTRVLRELVIEKVSLTDFDAILEALAEDGREENSTERNVALVRQRLSAQILSRLTDKNPIPVAVLSAAAERLLIDAVQAAPKDGAPGVEPGVLLHLVQSARKAVESMQGQGEKPILVVRDILRFYVSRTLYASGIDLPVVGIAEIPGIRQVRSIAEIS